MAITLKARVSRGAKLLDKASPGWAYKVQLGKLDISSAENCVLGQLFDDFLVGRRVVEDHLGGLGWDSTPDPHFTLAYGFDWYGFDGTKGHAYPKLSEHWRGEIRARRGRSGTNTRPPKAAKAR